MGSCCWGGGAEAVGIVWEADWTALYDSAPELKPSDPPHLHINTTECQITSTATPQHGNEEFAYMEIQEAGVKCNEFVKSSTCKPKLRF